MPSFESTRAGYAADWSNMSILTSKASAVEREAKRIIAARPRYEAVAKATGVPWFLIGLLHLREADMDFSCHLHNGDPLTARTRHVPSGRPAKGMPPFSWEDSAIDALQYDGLDAVHDWSIEHIAFVAEGYNGFGPRNHGRKSGYLWSGSNIYDGGKYVSDGQWSSTTWDSQLGVMPILRRMLDLGAFSLDGSYAKPIAASPAPVSTPPATPHPAAAAVVATAAVAASASGAGLNWQIIVPLAILGAALAFVIAYAVRGK